MEDYSEEVIKKGIDDALDEGKGYVIEIRAEDGSTVKFRFDGEKLQIKIGNRVFTTEGFEDLELIDRFLCCILARYYN